MNHSIFLLAQGLATAPFLIFISHSQQDTCNYSNWNLTRVCMRYSTSKILHEYLTPSLLCLCQYPNFIVYSSMPPVELYLAHFSWNSIFIHNPSPFFFLTHLHIRSLCKSLSFQRPLALKPPVLCLILIRIIILFYQSHSELDFLSYSNFIEKYISQVISQNFSRESLWMILFHL